MPQELFHSFLEKFLRCLHISPGIVDKLGRDFAVTVRRIRLECFTSERFTSFTERMPFTRKSEYQISGINQVKFRITFFQFRLAIFPLRFVIFPFRMGELIPMTLAACLL